MGKWATTARGTGENDVWRDTAILSLCRDDWESGVNKLVRQAMDRTCARRDLYPVRLFKNLAEKKIWNLKLTPSVDRAPSKPLSEPNC